MAWSISPVNTDEDWVWLSEVAAKALGRLKPEYAAAVPSRNPKRPSDHTTKARSRWGSLARTPTRPATYRGDSFGRSIR
jgi:hypothetical protein